jgi:predicted transcriptional regulator
MKTAVSIPDEVFQQAERVAKRLKKSRSELYAEALAEYLARREPATVTVDINAALADLPEDEDAAFVQRASRRTLSQTEW